jgi:hypothetical protein
MKRAVFNRMVLFFGAFLLAVVIEILVTSAHAQEPTWQWQQGQWPNQYTSYTVDNSALVKETEKAPSGSGAGRLIFRRVASTSETCTSRVCDPIAVNYT